MVSNHPDKASGLSKRQEKDTFQDWVVSAMEYKVDENVETVDRSANEARRRIRNRRWRVEGCRGGPLWKKFHHEHPASSFSCFFGLLVRICLTSPLAIHTPTHKTHIRESWPTFSSVSATPWDTRDMTLGKSLEEPTDSHTITPKRISLSCSPFLLLPSWIKCSSIRPECRHL